MLLLDVRQLLGSGIPDNRCTPGLQEAVDMLVCAWYNPHAGRATGEQG